MRSTTRRDWRWSDLTPKSLTDTGDTVDVLIDGKEPIRGVFCGLGVVKGRGYAELESNDGAWHFVSLRIPHAIRLVRESVSLPLHECERRLDALDPQPEPHSDLRWILAALVFDALFVLFLFLWSFWR